MIEKRVQSATEPPEVEFFELPGGLADVWIARNVERVEDVADNGPDPADAVPCVYYTADVAYMRAAVTIEEITADTDAAYKRAAAWAPEAITQPTTLERIEALEALGNDILAVMFGGELNVPLFKNAVPFATDRGKAGSVQREIALVLS